MALDPSLAMLSMLEMVHRAGCDVGADAHCLLPTVTRDALYRRGLLASYRTSRWGAKRFAITRAGLEALKMHRKRKRVVANEFLSDLIEAFKEEATSIARDMHR